MKISKLPCIAATLILLTVGLTIPLNAADTTNAPSPRLEYATIHWDGRDNTHIVLPNGEVKSLGSQLTKISKPNRTDDRAFYMNIAMNSLAKEGYEFVAIRDNDIVMKKAVTQ